jgi:hypothetical protein
LAWRPLTKPTYLHVFELNWIGFKLNWIELNSNTLNGIWIQFNFNPNKFNSNLVEFNSTIRLRFNWREWDQIGGEGSENLLVNMVLEVFKKKNIDPKRHNSIPFYFGMGSSLELSKWWLWLMEPKVVLPKLVLMNHGS